MGYPDYSDGSYFLVTANHTYMVDETSWMFVADLSEAFQNDSAFADGITTASNIAVYDVDNDELCDRTIYELDLINEKLIIYWLAESDYDNDRIFAICSGSAINETDANVFSSSGHSHYYPLDEASGNFIDESGSNDGAPTGTMTREESAVIGNGVGFEDEDNTTINFGQLFTSAIYYFTISMNAKFTELVTDKYQSYFYQYIDNDHLMILERMTWLGDYYGVRIANGGGTGSSLVIPVGNVPVDEWCRLAMVYDSSIPGGYDRLKVYINGIDVVSYATDNIPNELAYTNWYMSNSGVTDPCMFIADELSIRSTAKNVYFVRSEYNMHINPHLFYLISYPNVEYTDYINLIGDNNNNIKFSVAHDNYDLFNIGLKFVKSQG